MKTPIQLLRARKSEIMQQYNAALNLDPYHILNGVDRKKDNEKVIEFKREKQKNLAELKKVLDQYTEAINVLRAIKNMTF